MFKEDKQPSKRTYQRKAPPNRTGVFWGGYINARLAERVHRQMYQHGWTKTEALERLLEIGVETSEEKDGSK